MPIPSASSAPQLPPRPLPRPRSAGGAPLPALDRLGNAPSPGIQHNAVRPGIQAAAPKVVAAPASSTSAPPSQDWRNGNAVDFVRTWEANPAMHGAMVAAYDEMPLATQTALWFNAIEANQYTLLKFQIKAGFVASTGNADYRNGVHLALKMRHKEALRVLLRAGADGEGVSTSDAKRGASRLLHTLAGIAATKDSALFLLEAGADANSVVTDEHGVKDTPLGAATRSTGPFAGDIVHQLLKHGAEVNLPVDSGQAFPRVSTPLLNAIRNPTQPIAMIDRLLRHRDIDVGMADANGLTPRDAARWHKDGSYASALEPMISECSKRGRHRCADEWAQLAGKGYLPAMRPLYVRYGAEIVDCVGRSGQTALWHAAAYGRNEIVRQLLAWGADASLHNGDGVKAVDVAAERTWDDTAAILKAHARAHSSATAGSTSAPPSQDWRNGDAVDFVRTWEANPALHRAMEAAYDEMPPATQTAVWFNAIKTNQYTLLKFQIEAGFEATTGNADYPNGVHLALTMRHKEALRVLLRAGADAKGMSKSDAERGASRLLYSLAGIAATEDTEDSALFMLEAGAYANTEVTDERGVKDTPLGAATRSTGRYASDIVHSLVKHGADVNAEVGSGKASPRFSTPLLNAIRNPEQPIAMIGELLRHADIEVEKPDARGCAPRTAVRYLSDDVYRSALEPLIDACSARGRHESADAGTAAGANRPVPHSALLTEF
jgi:ankyrin repeat protein